MECFTELRRFENALMVFSGRFQVNKIGQVWEVSGRANAKAERCEAKWFVCISNLTDVVLCVR